MNNKIARRIRSTRKTRRINKSAPLPIVQPIAETKVMNNQEQACSTLIEESEWNNLPQQQNVQFWRAGTPQAMGKAPQSKGNEMGNISRGNIVNKVKIQSSKVHKYIPNIQIYKDRQDQYIQFRENLILKLKRLAQFEKNPISQPFIMGKQVLNLTEYIIAQPSARGHSRSCQKKQFQNKYMRALKQMKIRNGKNKQEDNQFKFYNSKYSQIQRCSSISNTCHNQSSFNSTTNFGHYNVIKFRSSSFREREEQQQLQRLKIKSEQMQRNRRNRNLKNIKICMHGYTVNINPQKHMMIHNGGHADKPMTSRNRFFIGSN